MKTERNLNKNSLEELLAERSMRISLTDGLLSLEKQGGAEAQAIPLAILNSSKKCHQKHLKQLEKTIWAKRILRKDSLK